MKVSFANRPKVTQAQNCPGQGTKQQFTSLIRQLYVVSKHTVKERDTHVSPKYCEIQPLQYQSDDNFELAKVFPRKCNLYIRHSANSLWI